MSDDREQRSAKAVPARWPAVPEPSTGPAVPPAGGEVTRDGRSWQLGAAGDLEWIAHGLASRAATLPAVPAVFEAYATVVLPQDRAAQERHDEALLSVLRAHSPDSPWWLGYLDTGADDVVFPDARRVRLYWEWPYVLVKAGPEQAATWRRWEAGSFWFGRLPNLMFPADRRWLVSTLWDDDWTCVGAPVTLVDDLLRHPELGSRTRRVQPGQPATPPGHASS